MSFGACFRFSRSTLFSRRLNLVILLPELLLQFCVVQCIERIGQLTSRLEFFISVQAWDDLTSIV